MRKLLCLLSLLLFSIVCLPAAAEEQYNVRITVTPFESKAGGLQNDFSYEAAVRSGQTLNIDLKIFQTAMTIEKYGEDMAFTFSHDLEMLYGQAVIVTHRIILEKYAIAHLRTPTMDAGAWLAVSWGDEDKPLVYQDFINSISSIYKGVENARYGAYEDYSIVFSVQSGWDKSEKSLGYAVMDIDGNGIQELLFGELYADLTGTTLYDLYTIEDGEIRHVFDGWERNRYYLTTDGTIMHKGSSSAFHYFTAYYSYADGEMNMIRSVIYDGFYNNNAPWSVSYINETEASTGRPITEAEAETIMNYYKGLEIEMTPFE